MGGLKMQGPLYIMQLFEAAIHESDTPPLHIHTPGHTHILFNIQCYTDQSIYAINILLVVAQAAGYDDS